MISWLTKLFTPTPNDWRLVEVMQGEWSVEYRNDFDQKHKVIKTSIYEIYYSPSKNECKLETSGYKPKEHDKYVTAVRRANELQNEITNGNK